MSGRRKFIKESALTAGALLSASIAFPEITSKENNASNIFLYGVASGDPLPTQLIIWTKINTNLKKNITVKWVIAKDINCAQIVQSEEASTGPEKDFTIKIDVQHLELNTTYYYQFITDEQRSPIGKTKTTAADEKETLRFAVVSCSDYAAGYYNALANIAQKKELDAVIHLGDYIYEGVSRDFDPTNNLPEDEYEATHFNKTKDWWLHYYRRRYAINRLDPDLQAAHQAHPFITVWDDHEIANNAWKDGAQGHNEQTDGDWEIRKSAAKQVYAEWMPIRGNAEKIYRNISFGKMAELILLDTRVEGRDKQIYHSGDASLYSPERTILGKDQKEWLFNRLKNSTCHWKLFASQVIFSEVNVKWAAMGGHFKDKVSILENTLLDYWEGYPGERDEVIQHISHNKIDNVVILSASMHCSMAFDVTKRATKFSRPGENATYEPTTSKGSVAVEFATPSITSANFDEKMEKFYAATFQSMLNKKLPLPLNYNPNPHLKFADLQKHGYFILTLTTEKAEAQYFFVEELLRKNINEKKGPSWHTKTGANKLQPSNRQPSINLT